MRLQGQVKEQKGKRKEKEKNKRKVRTKTNCFDDENSLIVTSEGSCRPPTLSHALSNPLLIDLHLCFQKEGKSGTNE